MNRHELKEKYPQLEIGCMILSHEEYGKGPVFIGCEMGNGNKIKMVYLDSFGFTSMNVCDFSEPVINKILAGKHTIYNQLNFHPALVFVQK